MSSLALAHYVRTYPQDMLKVMIVDDDPHFAEELRCHLCQDERFDVIGVAHDGYEALKLLKVLNPDVILLDLIMPKLDGFGMLQLAYHTDVLKNKKVIVMSETSEDNIVQYAIRLGASYFMYKPFTYETLSQRIHLIAGDVSHQFPNYYEDSSIQVNIVKYLIECGLPVHTLGYKYFQVALQHLIYEGLDVYSITKNVYPQVARIFKTSSANVDKAMRHALTLAFTQNLYCLKSFLNDMKFKDPNTKPSNSEFIGLMLERIKQETR
jgi:two-component system, response regulator, stage 0 sporulation protein A